MSPLRRLAAIVGWTPRVQAVGERIDRLGDEGFVAALDELARDAAKGASPGDVEAMLACALFFLRGREDRIAPLLEAARSTEKNIAVALLGEAAPHKALSHRGRLRDQGGPRRVIREATIRHPSADEMRAALLDSAWTELFPDIIPQPGAYEASRERIRLPPAHVAMQVRQLATRSDSGVIGDLLDDRAMGVREVVKIAARRPTMPALVEAIVARDRWIARLEVRAALVENPFTPTRATLLLLPTCRASLRALAKANVHPRVNELVALLSASA